MAGEGGNGVLRRKVAAGRRPHDTAMTDDSDRRAMTAVARVTEELLRLPVNVTGRTVVRRTVAEVVGDLEEGALIATLSAREGRGIAVVGPDALAALGEWLTIGRIGSGPVAARVPTRADLALVAPWVEAVLRVLSPAPADGVAGAAEWRVLRKVDDPRPLPLTMPDLPLAVEHLTLDFGIGPVRRGAITLAVPAPAEGRDDAGTGARAGLRADPATDAADWSARLGASVLAAGVPVSAVLWTAQLPLGMVVGLRPGALIGVPLSAVGAVALRDAGGRGLAEGRLGQAKGMKALLMHPALRGAARAGTDGGDTLSVIAAPDGTAGPAEARGAAAIAMTPLPAGDIAEAG